MSVAAQLIEAIDGNYPFYECLRELQYSGLRPAKEVMNEVSISAILRRMDAFEDRAASVAFDKTRSF
jgi:hypothetical protein